MPQNVKKIPNLYAPDYDDNAFVIMGCFRRRARREGWTEKEIEAVLAEAKSGDYDHLIETISNQYEEE